MKEELNINKVVKDWYLVYKKPDWLVMFEGTSHRSTTPAPPVQEGESASPPNPQQVAGALGCYARTAP